jgi:hypothetical protein
MKFSEYTKIVKETLQEKEMKQPSLENVIKAREKATKELGALRKYIAKDYLSDFDKGIKLIYPKNLKKIKKETEIKIDETLQQSIDGILLAMDGQLRMPWYGKKAEKLIKNDWKDVSTGLSYILVAKLDVSYVAPEGDVADVFEAESEAESEAELEELVNEGALADILGAGTGMLIGGALAGPAGVLLGAMLGAGAGEALAQKIQDQKDSTKAKWDELTDIDWEKTMINSGVALGTVAGLVAGSGIVAVAGAGLLGGLVGSWLHDSAEYKRFRTYDTSDAINKIKKFSIKTYNNILNTKILNERQRLARMLNKEYSVRQGFLKDAKV